MQSTPSEPFARIADQPELFDRLDAMTLESGWLPAVLPIAPAFAALLLWLQWRRWRRGR